MLTRIVAVALVATTLPTASGCGSNGPSPRATTRASDDRGDAWGYRGREGHVIRTAHYAIHTTIEDERVRDTLARVMEGALQQYRAVAPGIRPSPQPMECYVFAYRPEWAQFTLERTGDDAAVYLQINRGGYTVRDWYVAYFIGDVGTYAVAAHEGWHQFVARHFKSRLPPFLEEGIASMFETITWSNGRPHWRLAVNAARAERLRRAIETHSLWPLEELITLHAGDVVGLSGDRIETFYAQNWAFAQFLWEANGSRYRPTLQRMLSDLAAGTVPPSSAGLRAGSDLWQPTSARPLLEHYLEMPLHQIEREYLAYVRSIARARGRGFGSP